MSRMINRTLSALALLGWGSVCFAAVNVTVSQQLAPLPVGNTVKLTASASDTTNPNATFTYQFWIGLSGQPLSMVRDFYTFNSFPWTPSISEGTYDIQVMVHSSSGASGMGTAVYDVSAIATTSPVVSNTSHPLVALYSLPPCPAGHTARVRFKLPSDSSWHFTSSKTCNGQTSLNFYVGGMRPNSTYQLQHDLFNGPFDTPGPVFQFSTGAVPGGSLPGYSIAVPFVAPTNTAYPVLLSSAIGTESYATDTTGAVVWYLPTPDVSVTYFNRPVDGGTFLVQTTAQQGGGPSVLLREYDLAGNLVRETNTSALSQELVAKGADPVTTIHHDALRLANGSTVLIGSVEKVVSNVAAQGPGNVDVVGDQVMVLDTNFQLKWWWNEFHHFPITRAAVLGEVCYKGQAGCAAPTIPGYNVANDWTHSNAVWQTSDGNLMVSSRHQDWIVKIPYGNGSGPVDGAIIWTLGADGAAAIEGSSFQVVSSDPHPWFSHQHDPEFQANGLMSVFDNGNTRWTSFGGNSRGQAWNIDETHMVATLEVNIDLGEQSLATGSAQLLSNGNYTFDLGVIKDASASSTQEYTPANSGGGTLQSEQNVNKISYRTFRMRSMDQEH